MTVAELPRNRSRHPMVIPCVGCGRSGLTYHSKGHCSSCHGRDFRSRPPGTPVGMIICRSCGEEMLQHSLSGQCGFCESEMIDA